MLKFRYFVVILVLLIAAPLAMVTQPLFFVSETQIKAVASPELLSKYVMTLSEKLPKRHDDTDDLNVIARYIRKNWSPYGKVVDHEYSVWGIPYRNLSITFGPNSNKRIVVGAHYDSFKGLPGADDNASGVAALMELARMLSSANLKVPVQLIAYTLEEPPYFGTDDMGSAFHAKELTEKGVDVVAMISLEMIGYYADTPHSQTYPIPMMDLVYPDRGNYIAVVGNLFEVGLIRQVKYAMQSVMRMDVYSINAPVIIPGIDFSDHMNFWHHGFPALMITDTAFYRNLAYHSEEDTWDSLDYPKMADVVNGVYQAVISLSENP